MPVVFTTAGRALVGRRNIVRPLEIIGALLWSIASYWLLQVFPFDFAHLGDPLPGSLRFLLSWISDDIARILLTIGAVAGVAQVLYTASLLAAIRRQLKS